MNLTLFLRDKGRLVPTEAVDALYDSSRFLDEGISRLESRVASIRQGSGMRLAVMGVTLMMPHFIPQAILRLLRDMPALDFSVNTGIPVAAAFGLAQWSGGYRAGGGRCVYL